ncbi:class I SAM-dependent methyltransferase [Limosilactobacillus sp.]|uniref:class I SAM-dependent methyltransferase n=1 Tax=Limosilactobacillus sp. TaxID=2773925 RepID=UPI003EFE108A
MKLRGLNVVTILAVVFFVIVFGLVGTFASHQYWNLIWIILLLAWTLILLHTLTQGHLKIWQKLVDRMEFGEHAQILDLSASRLNDLLLLAKNLQAPAKVIGTGEWRQDRRGVQAQINAAGVADRVRLVDTDVFNMNFPDRSFDNVLVDLAFHNISPAIKRNRAVQEAARVLKADGTMAIVDFEHSDEYQQMLANLGFDDIRVVNTGFDGWWGGPWTTTKMIIARHFRQRK